MAAPTLTLAQLAVLALIQGITEFLPVSSSAHLILLPALTGWPDQGLEIDIAVHVGTLGAVLIYFRRDVAAIVAGIGAGLAGRATAESRLALALAVATLPLLAAGALVLLLDATALLRAPAVIAWATVLFALLLYAADRFRPDEARLDRLSLKGALFIGAMQMLALVPGTSRAGVTITGARLLGLDRVEAARFSMLLAIPSIVAAGGYAAWHLVRAGDVSLGWTALVAAVLAFVAALASIELMLRWLRRASYTPFVLYRLALGAGLLWWSYGL